MTRSCRQRTVSFVPLTQLSSMCRAFVVQFRFDSSVADRKIAGRAEHVRTGEVASFNSIEELLQFVDVCMKADREQL